MSRYTSREHAVPCQLLARITFVTLCAAVTFFPEGNSYLSAFLDKQCLLQLPEVINPREKDVETEGARELRFLFLCNDQSTSCPKMH
jgi:hypothetical protein